MAGSFGYVREHFEVSRAIGERRLLPAARALEPGCGARGERRRRAGIRSHDFTGVARAPPGRAPAVAPDGARMNLAVLSVAALALAVLVSCVSRLNVGVLAVALAWIIGVYIGGMPVEHRDGRLPEPAVSDARRRDAALRAGAVQRHARRGSRITPSACCRGNRGVDPDHVLRARRGAGVDGAGQHRDGRAVAPMAMATAARAGIPLFLMAIMVGNGANAGVALALRADRHHRQRPHGAQRAARARSRRPISTTCARTRWWRSAATSSSAA